MRMSLTQRSPSLWRLWVNLSLADGWLSRTIRPRITWQVLPDPDSFKQERLCGRSKYPSQARLDLKLTPEAVNILTGLLVGYHELVLKQFVEMFNLFATYINSAEDYLQFYTQIYSHCDATIRNLIWFRTKLHLCSNMISSQIFWSRALRRRWIRKSLRDSWVVSIQYIALNMNTLCYISGDKKLQAVLSNATKNSSTSWKREFSCPSKENWRLQDP